MDAIGRLERRQDGLIRELEARLERLEQYAIRTSGVLVRRDGDLRTHCKHGHALADAYVYYGKRYCRTCTKLRSQENYRAAKAFHEMFGNGV